MSAKSTTHYNPELEIRFAVVLYGGVSLAIYMNGVAQELLRMVRGTAELPSEEKLSGTERLYRELGQIIGRGDPKTRVAGGVDPDDTASDPIRTRFVVDIISGTSAGGINGVALAKALALKSRDLGALKEVWLSEADLDRLLNDSRSEPEKYPPHPSGKTTSLLNSERMYGKILETLGAMNDPGTRTAGAGAFADKLDLFVTATDLTGLPAPIQLSGHSIDERIHKTVFHFEYAAPLPHQQPSAAQMLGEFGADYDAMLAFAARCTSSFPVAFEPMRFERIERQLRAHHTDLTFGQAQSRYAQFFPAYEARAIPFSKRAFADGGYLDNRPFSHAINLIPYRSSTRPVKRKLLFVDPFPEIHDRHQLLDDREISFIENARLAAMSLPRYEVIRDDIRSIMAFNRRLDRLAALQERNAIDKRKLSITDKDSPPDFGNVDLQAMVETHGYGEFYPRYHHLRVYDTTDVLARMVTRLGGFETDSDEYYYIRVLLRAWREAHYAAYKEPGKQTENAFLDRFDTEYRLRRLNHLRSQVDQMLAEGGAEAAADGLMKVRDSAERQLAELRDKRRELESRSRSPLLNHPSVRLLKEHLRRRFDDVMGQTNRTARHRKATEVYRDAEIGPHVDAVVDAIADNLKIVFDRNREAMGNVLPSADDASVPEELRGLRRTYECFHWHDVLSLPFLEGSSAREHSEVEVYRVSPSDSGFVPAYVEAGDAKLTGTAVGAFGGFLQREWREHDMMWGRLDGAERIITALLPENSEAELRKDYIRRAHDLILAEEFSLDPRGRDRIFGWLAHKLREENVTDRSAVELAGIGEELLAKFPTLEQVVSRKDFRTFVLNYYSPPPPPLPEKVANWSARSLTILGRMIDDLPERRLGRIRARMASASRSAGVLLITLLRMATPHTLGRRLTDRLLTLLAIAALVMAVLGPIIGAPSLAIAGYVILLGCLGVWILVRTFGRWLRGRTRLWEPAFAVAGLAVLGLVLLGAVKLWELLQAWAG